MKTSNEDGLNSGVRNFGRLCLALVPYALGLGFAVWFGAWIGVHNYRHQLSQEERAAVYVGAAERPKAKIMVTIIPHDCTHLTRADVDGDVLLLYAKNDCHKVLRYMEYHWQLLSPSGTVLNQAYENFCAVPTQPGDSAECHLNIKDDDRAKTLRVWTEGE